MRVLLGRAFCRQLNSDTFQESVGKHTQISPLLCFSSRVYLTPCMILVHARWTFFIFFALVFQIFRFQDLGS